MYGIYWLILGGIALTIGDIAFKFWVDKSLPYFSLEYIVGLMVYVAGLIFLIESFKTENIAIASAVFVLINIVTLALVSWFYFGEKISLIQGTGLALGLGAILILHLGK